MTTLAQKSTELRQVARLQTVLGDLLPGTIDRNPTQERPDVLVVSDRTVGIEVVELVLVDGGLSQRKLESDRAWTVDYAKELALATGVPPINVRVYFDEKWNSTKSERIEVATALAGLVANHLPELDDSHHTTPWDCGLNLPCIRSVRMYRWSGHTKQCWHSAESGWAIEDCIQEIQKAIDEKNPKHAEYRKQCDECWLLLVASGDAQSGMFDPSLAARTHKYRSEFTKTCFLEDFTGEVIELQAERPA